MENCVYYIHETYIETGGWRESTWDWLMGQISGFSVGDTLVDVVASIWSLAGTVISKVKSAAQDVWNRIKAAGQFIANAVLSSIHNLIAQSLLSAVEAISHLFSQVLTSFDVTKDSDSLELSKDGNSLLKIDFGADTSGFWIELDEETKINIFAPMFGASVDVETLSPDFQTGFTSLVSWTAITTYINLIVGHGIGIKGHAVPSPIPISTIGGIVLATVTGFLFDLLTTANKQGEELELVKDRLASIHIGLALGMFSQLINRAGTTPSRTLRLTTDAHPMYGKLIKIANAVSGPSRKAAFFTFIFQDLIGKVATTVDFAEIAAR